MVRSCLIVSNDRIQFVMREDLPFSDGLISMHMRPSESLIKIKCQAIQLAQSPVISITTRFREQIKLEPGPY